MKKIDSLEEIQSIELDMLDYFDEICVENNLRYFLAGGTLLGAIRHKGFIPWDNDVDVSMPREDYMKLIKVMKEKQHPYYKILSISDDSDYYHTFAKIVDSRTFVDEFNALVKIPDLGVFLDVFPIDGVSKIHKIAAYELKLTNSLAWNAIKIYANISSDNENFLKRSVKTIVKKAIKNKSKEAVFNRIEKIMVKHNFDHSEFCASTYGLRVEKEIIHQDCFADYVEVEFENRKYRAPKGYDQYLRQMYGDYMQLPPKEKQIAPHDMDTYWKDGF